jgi:hypothetical protein
MKDQKESQIAFEIWNLTNKLSHLLWDRYEEEFIEIYLKEEEHKFLHAMEPPILPEDQDKTEE